MGRIRLLDSFRARLLLLFSFILLLTLLLQFSLSQWAQKDKETQLTEQEKALAGAMALGFKTLISQDSYLDLLVKKEPQTDGQGNRLWTSLPEWCLVDCREEDINQGRIRNVLVINDKGLVYDSLNHRMYGTAVVHEPEVSREAQNEKEFCWVTPLAQGRIKMGPNENTNKDLFLRAARQEKEIKDIKLPSPVNAGEVVRALSTLQESAKGDDVLNMKFEANIEVPDWLKARQQDTPPRVGDSRSVLFPVPVASQDESGRVLLNENGRPQSYQLWYIIVVLSPIAQEQGALWVRPWILPLALTLALLLVVFFVWQFTKPVAALSEGARRVAEGDFTFRVPVEKARDEMGQLAAGFNDMTARLARTRELEIQLNQAERSAVVGRLASAIAHEIRNPLTYINLTLDHFRSALAPEDPRKRETFERLAVQLKSEVARINKHITELLNYARPARLDLQPLDLRVEAEDAMRLVEGQAVEQNIVTHVVQEGDVPPVLADREWLRSILTNLMINSVQAVNGDGGKLNVNIHKDITKPLVYLEIADTGAGIPEDDLPKIFEPYFSTKETGTGLGLAIVKKAVEEHGGAIAVTSQVGQGTTFTITLPATRAPVLN